MNEEELLKMLHKLGLKQGGWNDRDATGPFEPNLIKKQKSLLRKLEALTEAQIEADRKKVEDLRIKVQKLKRGGGT
jgi:hypothetical protein